MIRLGLTCLVFSFFWFAFKTATAKWEKVAMASIAILGVILLLSELLP